MHLFTGVSLFTAVILTAGCSKGLHTGETPSKTGEAPVQEIKVSSAVVTNVNGFAFRLMNKIQETEPEQDNIFVSPLSLHMDLGMLLNGAEGNTYDEMAKLLDVNNLSLEDINKVYGTLLDKLPNVDPKVKLGLYNSVWYKKLIPFEPDYIKGLKDDFQAEVSGLDFKSTDTSYINKWVRDKTNNKIQKVLDKIDGQDVMYLLNALYFKGSWSTQFEKSKTIDADFHLENGQTSRVKMMNNTDDFFHYDGADYAAVRLPYGNGQFCMTIILPKEGKNIGELMTTFSETDWNQLQSGMIKGKVQIGLPRFTVPKYDIKLNDILKDMGMKSAFSDATANFKKMSKISGLFLSFIKQDSYLRVDEEGTEAAAVTTGGMVVTSMPIIPRIICDHPFGLVISEQTSNTILFMGRIMAPGTGE